MASPSAQTRSLYRRLLRELPSHPVTAPRAAPSKYPATAHQKLSAPSPIQQHIRNSLVDPSSSDTARKLAQAEQFVQYVQAQRMYAMLIERYNPGMGMSEEERVRLTARKVGMDLPPEFKGKK